MGAAATNSAASTTLKANAQTLLDGYNQRSDSISGVNLDEELANTIIYQNAYSASASNYNCCEWFVRNTYSGSWELGTY